MCERTLEAAEALLLPDVLFSFRLVAWGSGGATARRACCSCNFVIERARMIASDADKGEGSDRV